MPVRPVQHPTHRDAPRRREQAAVDAAFAAVRGVGDRFFSSPTAPCTASRRGISSQSPGQSTRRSLAKPCPRSGQTCRLGPTSGSGCSPCWPSKCPSRAGRHPWCSHGYLGDPAHQLVGYWGDSCLNYCGLSGPAPPRQDAAPSHPGSRDVDVRVRNFRPAVSPSGGRRCRVFIKLKWGQRASP